jgi:RecB family exonuclease
MPLEMLKASFFANHAEAYTLIEPLLLQGANTPMAICSRISYAINLVKPFTNNAMQLEFLYALAKSMAKLRGLVSNYSFGISTKSTRKIINRLLAGTTLPFYGEPLQGLQVMGMLETRTLDFDTVFILSANDDVLPSSGRSASFIPFDIRIEGAFNLPVFRHKTAIFAYHFYHLLHRSRQMHIFYNTEPGNLGGGEMSRFVTQVMQELPKTSAKVSVQHQIISEHPHTEPYTPWIIDKSPEIMAKLQAKATSGFSPSALNNYIKCPLLFYFKQILGIAEQPETGLEIDPARFGTIIHDALFAIYGGKKPNELSTKFLQEQQKHVAAYVEAAFKQTIEGVDIAAGNNRLMYEVAMRIVKDFLTWESEELQNGNTIKLLALETEFKAKLQLTDVEGIDTVLIKGRFDRVDIYNGITRIIDYKTGRFLKQGPTKDQSWQDILTDASFEKVFQLLVYAWIYQNVNPQSKPQAGIISFKELSEGFTTHKMPGEFEEHILQTKALLNELLKEIFSPQTPFGQTNDPKNCEWCSFRNLCGRN